MISSTEPACLAREKTMPSDITAFMAADIALGGRLRHDRHLRIVSGNQLGLHADAPHPALDDGQGKGSQEDG